MKTYTVGLNVNF